jgi:hypothetical protein
MCFEVGNAVPTIRAREVQNIFAGSLVPGNLFSALKFATKLESFTKNL